MIRRILRSLSGGRNPGHVGAAAWRSGDLAVCIHHGPWFQLGSADPTTGPRHGDVLRVAGVLHHGSIGNGLVFLVFADRAEIMGWDAQLFRKAVHDGRAVETDAEFLASLDQARPAPAPAMQPETAS